MCRDSITCHLQNESQRMNECEAPALQSDYLRGPRTWRRTLASLTLLDRGWRNLNARHFLNECHDRGVVQIALSLVHQRNQNLLYRAG